MRVLKKILLTTVIGSALLFTACGGIRPQPYSSEQYTAAKEEAELEARRTADLEKEKNRLESELAIKRANLVFLQEWEREGGKK